MAARKQYPLRIDPVVWEAVERWACLLYTSDAADEL